MPTPTSAYSTLLACFSTCWMAGSGASCCQGRCRRHDRLGITVAEVRSADLRLSRLEGQNGLQVALHPASQRDHVHRPDRPNGGRDNLDETVSPPQPTPRLAPGRRWVLMNWAPPALPGRSGRGDPTAPSHGPARPAPRPGQHLLLAAQLERIKVPGVQATDTRPTLSGRSSSRPAGRPGHRQPMGDLVLGQLILVVVPGRPEQKLLRAPAARVVGSFCFHIFTPVSQRSRPWQPQPAQDGTRAPCVGRIPRGQSRPTSSARLALGLLRHADHLPIQPTRTVITHSEQMSTP